MAHKDDYAKLRREVEKALQKFLEQVERKSPIRFSLEVLRSAAGPHHTALLVNLWFKATNSARQVVVTEEPEMWRIADLDADEAHMLIRIGNMLGSEVEQPLRIEIDSFSLGIMRLRLILT